MGQAQPFVTLDLGDGHRLNDKRGAAPQSRCHPDTNVIIANAPYISTDLWHPSVGHSGYDGPNPFCGVVGAPMIPKRSVVGLAHIRAAQAGGEQNTQIYCGNCPKKAKGFIYISFFSTVNTQLLSLLQRDGHYRGIQCGRQT